MNHSGNISHTNPRQSWTRVHPEIATPNDTIVFLQVTLRVTPLELDVFAELLHNKLITREPITPTRSLGVHRSRTEPLWVTWPTCHVPVRSRMFSTRYRRLMDPVRF